MPPPCAWCGSLIRGRRFVLKDSGRPVSLHLWSCLIRWVETERALGHRVPGEALWRPAKKGKR